jgi:lipopolysaccharide transport system ATP-binding protein
MNDTVIKVENVSKKYCRFIKHTMLYGSSDLGRSFFGLNQKTDRLRKGEFWAVDDVSFEVKRGETLGIIGPNGSGKSTILKMLNGIFMPDKGRIEIKGRVGALIEVGAGFHPMLTGKENIYVNGAILGMSKKEIDKKFDEIVNFAELWEFIDSPVKHYSSGMLVRLGFSVAAHCEPDVMLIDEVLAVGDIGFRAKCFNAIGRIAKNAAIVLVSHSMPQVARVCSDIIVLNHGKATYTGEDVPKGINHYYSHFKATESIVTGSGRATIHKVELESKGEKDIKQINYLDDLTVHLYVTVDPEIKCPIVFISFLSQELQIIAQCSSLYNKVKLQNVGEPMHITVKFPAVNFNPGVYFLSASVLDETQREVLVYYYAIKELKVLGEFVSFAPIQLVGKWDVKQQTISDTTHL